MAVSVVVVHYAEIALKGGNRPWFENRLMEHLREVLRGTSVRGVRRRRGRILVDLDAAAGDVPEVLARLSRAPGVAWYAAAEPVDATPGAIEHAVVTRAREGSGTFRVETRRADKRFPLTSMDLNRAVGAAVVAATGRRVRLTDPDDTYGIEIADDGAFVFSARLRGPGGLPVGSSGRVVALLSGGIDSPVAAWRMMRRGCRVDGVHFLNDSQGREGVIEKLDLLGAALARRQGRFRLHVVPFGDLQRAIVAAVPADRRMLVYRRAMLHLADRIRRDRHAGALVTGDSVGQVASQTLANLGAVYAAVAGPILAPLCGSEKTEIIEEARAIGTYEPSVIPHDDCCSFLVSPHPATRTSREELEGLEARVEWGDLREQALRDREVRRYDAVGA